MGRRLGAEFITLYRGGCLTTQGQGVNPAVTSVALLRFRCIWPLNSARPSTGATPIYTIPCFALRLRSTICKFVLVHILCFPVSEIFCLLKKRQSMITQALPDCYAVNLVTVLTAHLLCNNRAYPHNPPRARTPSHSTNHCRDTNSINQHAARARTSNRATSRTACSQHRI